MAGQTNISSPYPGNEQFGALILLIFVSGIAGIALGLLGGFNFPKLWFFPGYNLKPIIKGIVIPPLIAMIVMGCIVRNYFGETMIPYPQPWTGWIRGFCLCILLIRGGLQVTFKGQGLTVIFISFVPQVCEATVIAFMAQSLFDMPLAMGYVLGYNLACISPSIIVPGLMSLNDRGYGKKKNIAGMLIAAGTFDDIICIICFGICKTIVLNEGGFNKGQSMGLALFLFTFNTQYIQCYRNAICIKHSKTSTISLALFIGITLGLGGWFLKFIKNPTLNIYLKLLYCVIGAMVLVIIEEHAGTKDCKYIAQNYDIIFLNQLHFSLDTHYSELNPQILNFQFYLRLILVIQVSSSLIEYYPQQFNKYFFYYIFQNLIFIIFQLNVMVLSINFK